MATEWRTDRAERVAVVTGGSRGVGRATIHRLAARGYAVVVNYLHDRWAAESIVDLVLAAGGDAVAIRADVGDDVDVARLFAEAIDAFGGVDVVVHTVRAPATATTVADVNLDELDQLCRINLRATLLVSRQAPRDLRRGGALVNLASPQPAYGIDAATRAAADILTATLAVELRHRGITVAAVALEVGRSCSPDLIAEVVAVLADDQDPTLTGHVVGVDDPRLHR
jgi:3-oxoacyl-[acyl-carrier protein] reductase